MRYPEALLSPYWASSAKIALANNFQSDGDGGGGEGQGEEVGPDIDYRHFTYLHFTNELDVYQKQIILCTNEPFVCGQAMAPFFLHIVPLLIGFCK